MWDITQAWMTVVFNGRRVRTRHGQDKELRGRLLNEEWDAKGWGMTHRHNALRGPDTWRRGGWWPECVAAVHMWVCGIWQSYCESVQA